MTENVRRYVDVNLAIDQLDLAIEIAEDSLANATRSEVVPPRAVEWMRDAIAKQKAARVVLTQTLERIPTDGPVRPE